MIDRRQMIKGLAATASASFLKVGAAVSSTEAGLSFRSAGDHIAAIRQKEVSALELLEFYLERIERVDGPINSVVALNPDAARTRAGLADEALKRGENWGPLHGLPMTIKDTIEVTGMPTTYGSMLLRSNVPPVNATAVQRLIDAGAVIFGKTNVPLYGDDIQTYNALYGTTNNPWNVSRTPGGSSGGAAAALAAGLTGLELGSDIGGSIRTPAHFCGVYGHKPSYHIVPHEYQLAGIADMDLVVVGPLARSAEDLELSLEAIAGPNTQESAAWRLELPLPRHENLRDYKIAAWLDDKTFPTDAETLAVLDQAVAALRGAGVSVDMEARPIGLAYSHATYMNLLAAAYAPTLEYREFSQWIQSDFASILEEGYSKSFVKDATQRHRDWLVADHARREIRAHWAEFFKRFDLLICPVTQTPAFAHNQVGETTDRTTVINGKVFPYLDQLVWAGLATMPYLPATAAPVGLATSGLPVGLQIIGPYLEDRTTIGFAKHLAEVVGGFIPPPNLA